MNKAFLNNNKIKKHKTHLQKILRNFETSFLTNKKLIFLDRVAQKMFLCNNNY